MIGSLFLILPVHAQTTITAGSTRFNADTPGTYNLNSGVTRSVTSGSNEAIRIAPNSTEGTYTVNVDGTVSQTDGGRGIRSQNTGTGVNVVINIGSTGFVQSAVDDAIQGRNLGTFTLTNLGTLYSGPNFAATPTTGLEAGRGLNLRSAGALGGTITNGSASNTTALMRSDGNDAVRVHSGFTFINYGTVNAAGVVNDSSSNNALDGGSTATDFSAGAGFSFEDITTSSPAVGAANSSLDNYGTVTGARHGVQAGTFGTGLIVTNRAGALIVGRNGSGIGYDTTETDPTKIVVHNYGTIRGDYAGVGNVIDVTGNASPTHDGDGDGIDIDGAATIHNYSTGHILSTGAGGFDSSGRANNSEAISIGGGVIVNHGLIQGATRGILVNNDSVASRSGLVATSITNHSGATIEGQAGFAIRLENKWGDTRDNDTLVNAGTIIGHGSIPDPASIVTIQGGGTDIHSTGTLDGVAYTGTGLARFIRGDGAAIQMGEGNDSLTNTGTITGNTGLAISMEGGDDTVTLNGGTVTGAIDGGTGSDTLALGSGVSNGAAIKNFETFSVNSGTGTLSGVVSGSSLTKTGAGTLVLSGANLYTDGTTVSAGTLRVNNSTGSGTGTGDVVVASGAFLTGAGTVNGNVNIDGIFAPGNSIGTFTVNGDVTWNGTPSNAWEFELGSNNTADILVIGGDFIKGTSTAFVFDFGHSGVEGVFRLVDWAGSTTFAAEDFSFINLGSGFSSSFAINGSALEFTVVSAIPEPSTYAMLAGLGALVLAASRRR